MQLASIVLSLALLLPATSAVAQNLSDMEQVIRRERGIWQDVKEKDYAAFRAAMDSSYMGLSHYGSFGMPVEAARYEWTSLDHYTLTEFVTQRLDVNTVIVTYKADLKGRSLGLKIDGVYWMATIWKLQNDEWKAVFHAHARE